MGGIVSVKVTKVGSEKSSDAKSAKSISEKDNKRVFEKQNAELLIDEMISQDLTHDHEQEMEKVKILILGTAACGKSTVFKQMKTLYGVKFSERQRKNTIPIIHRNIIVLMKALCEAVNVFEYRDIIDRKLEFENIIFKDQEDILDLNAA